MDGGEGSGARRRWAALAVAGLAVTAVAAWRVPDLRIDTDLTRLLPDSPAAQDYREYVETFGGFERVHVLLSLDADAEAPDDPDARERLADAASDFAERIAGSDRVRSVRAGVTERDERFVTGEVLPRAALLVPDSFVDRIAPRLTPEAIVARVRAARTAMAGPLGEVAARVFVADPLGFAEGLPDEIASGSPLPVDPVEGAFLADDGRTALVIVEPAVAELDTAFGARLEAALDAAAAAVREVHGEDIAIAAIGGPLYAVRDERDIRGDVARTVMSSSIVIAVLLLIHFRGVRVPLAVLAAVLAGVVWTAGALAVVHERVTVLAVAFGAIVIGLGVDYGIHGAHAWREERRAGADAARAMALALRRTGRSVLASAATTAGVFGVLAAARFAPVRELGSMVAIGIAAIVVASVAIGAAAVVLTAGHERVASERGSRAIARAVGLVHAHRRATRWVLAVATAVALVGASRISFDVDLRSFRPEHRVEHAAERALFERFAIGADPIHVVVHAPDRGEALERARRLAEALRALPAVRSVRSPADLLPAGPDAERRAARLAATIPPGTVDRLRAALVAERFRLAPFEPALAVLEALSRGTPPPPVPESAQPDWIRSAIRVAPDRTSVALTVTGDSAAGELPEGLAAAARAIDPDVKIASGARLGAELRRLIVGEFERLLGWCLAAIVAIVALTFAGDLRRALLALVPVALGVTWLLGICGWAGIPLDFLTITAAPLLLGIGIDDGLHAIHGASVHGGIAGSLRHVGGAIAITTWTTCAGFGSLALSHLPALRNGGPLIALGTFLCLVATVVALPALVREPRP